MNEKRFQECNVIQKLWRLRWYLALPFIWFYYQFLKPFEVGETEVINKKVNYTDKFDVVKGITLWKILIGDIQFKMKWYSTSEEVFERIKKFDT